MDHDTQELQLLRDFREQFYASALGHRKDSQFALLEAVMCASGPESLVRLSLAPPFQRCWSSACDALAAGSLDATRVRRLCVRALPTPPADQRGLWVIDATTWPRPSAGTSPDRTYCHRGAMGIPQSGVVPGWEYQWLVAVPEAQGSWVLPLDVRRRRPDSASPTALALEQVHAALAARATGGATTGAGTGAGAGAPLPLVIFDSGYDPAQLAGSKETNQADFLVRLARNRLCYRAPGPYSGRGAPCKHGDVFRLSDPATHGEPAQRATGEDPEYGQIEVVAWTGLHVRRAAAAPFAVIRVQVEHLPRRKQPPAPMWLAWTGKHLPEDLLLFWRWYCRRFTVEHGFRVAKRAVGWTTIRPRSPEAADLWSWLIAVLFWQLWLARPLVADARLPWERPLPAERLTPGRVRRAFPGLLARLGSPARVPKPRGKSPGRRLGDKPGRRTRHPVVRRTAKPAA